MKNLVKIALVVTAFAFVAGCGSNTKPCDTSTPTAVSSVSKVKMKKAKKCKGNKLGKKSYSSSSKK